ncbi:uncharacterized mitochondrial protein-like protein [Tanacetum coccineum]
MEAGTTSTTLTPRLPIPNPVEYDIWLMRIEQYFLMTDYSLWEDRRNEMKARGTLLMALPNKDQLKFLTYKDAKLLMEAIEKRLQKLISQLEIQGEVITQEDMNLKLLRSLPSEWKTHALIWRNKEEIETISLDDFYNNLKIYEPELARSSNNTAYGVSAAYTQCNPTIGDNLSDAMISRRFIQRTGRKSDVNGQRVGFDRSKVECYNCHKNCHFVRECRAPRNQENRQRENNRTAIVETLTENALVAQDGIGGYELATKLKRASINFALMAHTSLGSSSSSDSEVDSCSKSCVKAYATLKEQYDSLSSDYKRSQFNLVSYKAGLESVEARLAHYKKNKVVFEESINVLNLEVKLRDNALVENKKKLEKAEKERDELKLTLEKFQNSSKSLNNLLESQVIDKFKTRLGYNAASSTAASPAVESFVNSSEMLENQENNKSRSDKGYHAVPPPFTGNFIPFKPDLTFMDEIVESENIDVITVVTPSNVKKIESNHEDWNSDDESEVEFIPNVKDKTVRPSTEKIKLVKSAKETIEKVIRPVWNNSSRVNHKNFANKMTHPHPNRRFVPQAVLTKSGKINTAGASVNTAVRPVNTAGSKPTVNHPRPISNAYKKGYSQVTRPFNKYSEYKNSIFNKKVNIVRVKDTTTRDRVVGNPQQNEYKENVERAITTDASLVTAQDSDNIIMTQTTTMHNVDIPQGMDTGGSPRLQETMGVALAQNRSERVLEKPNEPPLSEGHTSGSGEGSMEHTFELMDIVPPTPHDLPLTGGYTPGSDEGRLKLKELMAICTKLSKQVLDLEKEKDAQAVEILKLNQKVKKLERKRNSSISHPRRRIYRQVESSDDDLDEEDASKQGRESDKTKLMFQDSDFDVLDDDMEYVEGETVHTATTGISAVSAPVTTDGKAKEKRVAIKDVEDSPRPIRLITTLQPLPTIDPTDKGKGVLVKEEFVKPEKVKRRDQGLAQIESDAEAQRLHEGRVAEMDADHELAVRLTHEEQEKYTIEERATLLAEYFEIRKKHLVAERAEAIRNKPPTRAQVRNKMITYLKHMGKYTHQQLKHKTLEELQKLYQKEHNWINDFKPIDSEEDGSNTKKADKRIKRIADSTSKQKSPKKSKVIKEQESAKSNEEAAVDYEQEKEELRMWLAVVLDEDKTVDPEILSVRYPIVDWESHNLGSVDMEDIHVYKIIRTDRNTSYHKTFSSMLRGFDRQDLMDLHRLVMKRYEDNNLEGYNLLLWGDLKSLLIADGWYFDLLQHVSREKISSHQGNVEENVELEARS